MSAGSGVSARGSASPNSPGRPVSRSSPYVEPIHVHLAAAFGNVSSIEHHSTVLNEVLESPPALENGQFTPPDEPGHGVRFSGLEKYEKRV